MNKAHIELLQDRYIEAVNGYVAAYNDKYHVSPICWLHGEIGGTLIFDNFKHVDFRVIKADIDNELPLTEGLASQTDNMNFMESDEVCGNCKSGEVQSDGCYCRCSKRGNFHKYLDSACNLYERGGNK